MEYKDLKRILDIIFSIIGLCIVFPVGLVIAIVIKLDDGGPIIYKQKRIGKDSKEFIIYKFRTMSIDNDINNLQEKDRVTNFGRYLRRLGIDEWPQLWNIFKGEMSFVGPRPHVCMHTEFYTEIQRHRLDVLPGLFSPSNNETKKRTILEKIDADIDYVNNFSLKKDLELIFNLLVKLKKILDYRITGSKGNKETIAEDIQVLKENYMAIYGEDNESKVSSLSVEYKPPVSSGENPEDKMILNRKNKYFK